MLRDPAPTQAKGQLDRWLAAFDAYSVQYLILDTQRDRELLRRVQSNPGWAVDFQEGNSILFARSQAHTNVRVAAWQGNVNHERIQADVLAFKTRMNGHGKLHS